MEKPVIVCVDDEAPVLRAVARDLRQRYGEHYRILSSNDPREALDMIAEQQQKRRQVALFLVDQRMPELNGTDLLQQARQLFPEAKCALLTAYADTSVAIQAINELRLDYYLLKPWDPPEQNLYPVIDDLLQDWQANTAPPFGGVLVIDHRWSAAGHELRDFLARNHVPYRWLDVEQDSSATEFYEQDQDLPVAVLGDGQRLLRADPDQIAAALQISGNSDGAFYDLLIVGAGPAGLAAAVYAASEGLQAAVIEQSAPGGQAGTSTRIENYLGFPTGLSGSDLARRAQTQAERFGAQLILPRHATQLSTRGPYHELLLDNGDRISCRSVLLACGVQYRKLKAEGIDRLEGAGIYYGAASTEAALCQDQTVIIIGGGNSAGQAAIHMAQYAHKIYILIRGASLSHSMSDYLIKRINELDNIEVCWHTQVRRVSGEQHLESVTIGDTRDEFERDIEASAMFIFIGAIPRTEWICQQIIRDKQGYILTGNDLYSHPDPGKWPLQRRPFLTETSIPGIFAAGDVRYGSVKRVASAVGEGSITVQFVHQHLSDQ
ncbi:MAG: FAD-dependent oxidoreductase [Wenzhouxiangellaceae bacterium]